MDPTSRRRPATSRRSSRPSGSSTLATDGPPGLRSLCAIDRYRTVEPSLFRRDDVRRYTPTAWPPITRTGNPYTAETCTYTFAAPATATARRPATSAYYPPRVPISCGTRDGPRVVRLVRLRDE